MILKVNDKLKRKFWEYVSYEECINIYIIADVESYGFETDFLDVWIQVDNNENICAVMLKYYNTLILYSYENNYDVDEVIEHIENINVDEINGKKSVIDKLTLKYKNYKESKECYFCCLKNLNNLDFDDLKSYKIQSANVSDLEDIHELLKKSKNLKSDNYIELKSYQLKTQSSRVYYIKEDKKIISTCATGIENDFLSMINAIATDESYRNRGLATYLVYNLSKKLLDEGKYACLYYDNKEIGKIYSKIGYELQDNWVMLFK